MSHHGKFQLTAIIVSPPELVEEGDRLFRSHAEWMEATHFRTGEKALLSYNVSKGPEVPDPTNPESRPGATAFVLTEVYESEAGVADHMEQAAANWKDWNAYLEWAGKSKVMAVPSAQIFNSLW